MSPASTHRCWSIASSCSRSCLPGAVPSHTLQPDIMPKSERMVEGDKLVSRRPKPLLVKRMLRTFIIMGCTTAAFAVLNLLNSLLRVGQGNYGVARHSGLQSLRRSANSPRRYESMHTEGFSWDFTSHILRTDAGLHFSMHQVNGLMWLDDRGERIQAHGGCMIEHSGIYYWYGEVKLGSTTDNGSGFARSEAGGISVYSSTDLKTWRLEDIALPTAADQPDLQSSRVIERPRVLYHMGSGMFVMWLHIDNAAYSDACVGVAVSSTAVGPFTYLGSFRPNGKQSRDFTVFQDTDGTAWLVYSSNGNADLHVTKLTHNYLEVEQQYHVVLPGHHREAPIIWKMGSLYLMWTSGCTGWKPNRAALHIARRMSGPWILWGWPACSADARDKGNADFQLQEPYWTDKQFFDTVACQFTFFSQGTWAMPYPSTRSSDTTSTMLWMADRWNEKDLPSSGFVWLKLTVQNDAPSTLQDLNDLMYYVSARIEWTEFWYEQVS